MGLVIFAELKILQKQPTASVPINTLFRTIALRVYVKTIFCVKALLRQAFTQKNLNLGM
jgi:hypothetical protein